MTLRAAVIVAACACGRVRNKINATWSVLRAAGMTEHGLGLGSRKPKYLNTTVYSMFVTGHVKVSRMLAQDPVPVQLAGRRGEGEDNCPRRRWTILQQNRCAGSRADADHDFILSEHPAGDKVDHATSLRSDIGCSSQEPYVEHTPFREVAARHAADTADDASSPP